MPRSRHSPPSGRPRSSGRREWNHSVVSVRVTTVLMKAPCLENLKAVRYYWSTLPSHRHARPQQARARRVWVQAPPEFACARTGRRLVRKRRPWLRATRAAARNAACSTQPPARPCATARRRTRSARGCGASAGRTWSCGACGTTGRSAYRRPACCADASSSAPGCACMRSSARGAPGSTAGCPTPARPLRSSLPGKGAFCTAEHVLRMAERGAQVQFRPWRKETPPQPLVPTAVS